MRLASDVVTRSVTWCGLPKAGSCSRRTCSATAAYSGDSRKSLRIVRDDLMHHAGSRYRPGHPRRRVAVGPVQLASGCTYRDPRATPRAATAIRCSAAACGPSSAGEHDSGSFGAAGAMPDGDAFGARMADLVARNGDRLLRVGFQLTHDRAAAQDLVQGALVRVYSAVRRGGREPQDWYAYLRRAVINEYLRTRRLLSGTEVVTDRVPEAPPAESAEGRVDDRAEVWAVLGKLSARQRAVLVLRYYEGLPDGEIAALLGCREASVRSLARRGLAAMRRLAVPAGVAEEGAI